ncbi:MAG TPA: branched-chain amino acid ABC transporter substrate-binding protein [Aliidongia sp.]|nr:branched-chain amino acid ABC transporter substrate-binding protein [Aliidongia sp.]
MRRSLISLAVLGALALSAGARADILIGMAGPITGSNAAFGEQFKRGSEKAVADLNAKGGVLGQKLSLSVGDDACDAKQAVAVANQLASKNVVFVAGHFCSSSSIPASAVYADAGILQISPGSTNPALTEDAAKKGWDNVYRTCGRDDVQGKVAGEYLAAHYKGKSVAIVDDKSTYGKGIADETRKAMNAAGLKEAVDEQITAGDKDFSALISKLKQANVAAIYFGGYQVEAGLIVRQAHEQGLKAILLGGDSLNTQEFWQITGPAGEGTLFTFAPDPEKSPSAKALVDAFKKDGYEPEGYTLYSYAAVQIFAQAAEKAKSTKLKDLVKAMHDTTFETVIGPIKYDAKGDITQGGFVVWKWNGDGKFSELSAG